MFINHVVSVPANCTDVSLTKLPDSFHENVKLAMSVLSSIVKFMDALKYLLNNVLFTEPENEGAEVSLVAATIVRLFEHKVLPSPVASFGVMQADQLSAVVVVPLSIMSVSLL